MSDLNLHKNLLIISKKWPNRGNYTSVERFCHILNPQFEQWHGKKINIPYKIARGIRNASQSKKSEQYSTPYSTASAMHELWGLMEIIRKRPKYIFFPYADYDYNYIGLFKKLLGIKIILWSYFSESELNNRFKSLRHFARADLILAAGHEQVKYLKRNLPGSKIEFFPMGVDTDFFFPSETVDKYRIVLSGVNRRDFDTAYRALDMLFKDYSQLKVDFIGTQAIASELPDRPYLTKHDFLSDTEMRSVYQKANIQILPLIDGGSSNSLNEGLACGLPQIVTDLPNINDYLKDTFCLRVPKSDANELYQNCKRLIEDDLLRHSFGVAAREEAMKYSWKNLTCRFEALIQTL
jgi:glycosyltransferase involved in cell wall biosynthesis